MHYFTVFTAFSCSHSFTCPIPFNKDLASCLLILSFKPKYVPNAEALGSIMPLNDFTGISFHINLNDQINHVGNGKVRLAIILHPLSCCGNEVLVSGKTIRYDLPSCGKMTNRFNVQQKLFKKRKK